MEMVNGYVFLDLTKANVYGRALKVLGADKPVVIKDGSGSPYFVDSLTLDGTNVVITKGGKTITITDANTVSSTGLVANPTMENIVDLVGNKRFIGGSGVPTEKEGITYTYNKWSLSGTHLMIVVAGSVADTTVIGNNEISIEYTLPKWIFDKIVPVWSNIIERKSVSLRANNWSEQNIYLVLGKLTDTLVVSNSTSTLTLTADRNFRIQFDLLIDNE